MYSMFTPLVSSAYDNLILACFSNAFESAKRNIPFRIRHSHSSSLTRMSKLLMTSNLRYLEPAIL
jgi:hypothetical protein